MTPPTNAQMRRYLLRQLPEPEAEAFEAVYFADPDVAGRLEDLDDDLVRAYLDDTLDAHDRDAFERATTPARRARIAFIQGTRAHALPTASSARRAPAYWPALAAAALILAAIAGWWMSGLGRQAPASPEQAVAPRPTAPSEVTPIPSPAAAVVALSLSVISMRGAGETPTIAIPAGASVVVLRLSEPLPPPATLSAEVRAVDEERVWRGEVTGPGPAAPAGITVEVSVPAADLPPGDYVLTIRRSQDILERAYFRVAGR